MEDSLVGCDEGGGQKRIMGQHARLFPTPNLLLPKLQLLCFPSIPFTGRLVFGNQRPLHSVTIGYSTRRPRPETFLQSGSRSLFSRVGQDAFQTAYLIARI
jgi:hypothetical protein